MFAAFEILMIFRDKACVVKNSFWFVDGSVLSDLILSRPRIDVILQALRKIFPGNLSS